MAFARVPCALMNWPPIWQDRRQAPQIRRCGRRPTPLWPGRRALGNWLEMASGKQVLPCRPAFRNQPTNVAAALGRIKPKPWIWSGCSGATDICRYRSSAGTTTVWFGSFDGLATIHSCETLNGSREFGCRESLGTPLTHFPTTPFFRLIRINVPELARILGV
jgi:hypothetical protein